MDQTSPIAAAWRPQWSGAFRLILLGVAGVVIYAAFTKLTGVSSFRDAVKAQAVVPSGLLEVVVWSVPIVELLIGVAAIRQVLAGSEASVWAASALAGLFVEFACYAAVLWAFPPPRPAPCACGFGRAVITDWSQIAGRNAGVGVFLCAGGLVTNRRARRR